MDIKEYIEKNGDEVVFRGTTIPVSALQEAFDSGVTLEEFNAQYPELTEEQIGGVLEFLIGESLGQDMGYPWSALSQGNALEN